VSVLRDVVAAVDPALREHATAEPGPARFEDLDDPEMAFVLEAVYEGHLMHHEQPRAFAGMDEDLRLLAGDALYALGLSQLAERGDLDAVAELAELISLCAWARSEGRTELADTLWEASARRLAGRGGDGARAALDAGMRGG
jgi:hypothetical protein